MYPVNFAKRKRSSGKVSQARAYTRGAGKKRPKGKASGSSDLKTKKSCTKGIACGRSCIAANKTCGSTTLKNTVRAAAEYLKRGTTTSGKKLSKADQRRYQELADDAKKQLGIKEPKPPETVGDYLKEALAARQARDQKIDKAQRDSKKRQQQNQKRIDDAKKKEEDVPDSFKRYLDDVIAGDKDLKSEIDKMRKKYGADKDAKPKREKGEISQAREALERAMDAPDAKRDRDELERLFRGDDKGKSNGKGKLDFDALEELLGKEKADDIRKWGKRMDDVARNLRRQTIKDARERFERSLDGPDGRPGKVSEARRKLGEFRDRLENKEAQRNERGAVSRAFNREQADNIVATRGKLSEQRRRAVGRITRGEIDRVLAGDKSMREAVSRAVESKPTQRDKAQIRVRKAEIRAEIERMEKAGAQNTEEYQQAQEQFNLLNRALPI